MRCQNGSQESTIKASKKIFTGTKTGEFNITFDVNYLEAENMIGNLIQKVHCLNLRLYVDRVCYRRYSEKNVTLKGYRVFRKIP